MSKQKHVLINDLFAGNEVALFQDEIAPKTRKSTNKEKAVNDTGNNNGTTTALIIALIGLLILVGIYVFQNMNENE